MSNTVKIVNSAALQEAGTKALIKELGVTGMVRYLEQYDNGGSGDYTKEKYEREQLSIDEIVDLSSNFDFDDNCKSREYDCHVTQNMMVCEKVEHYNAVENNFKKEIDQIGNDK